MCALPLTSGMPCRDDLIAPVIKSIAAFPNAGGGGRSSPTVHRMPHTHTRGRDERFTGRKKSNPACRPARSNATPSTENDCKISAILVKSRSGTKWILETITDYIQCDENNNTPLRIRLLSDVKPFVLFSLVCDSNARDQFLV